MTKISYIRGKSELAISADQLAALLQGASFKWSVYKDQMLAYGAGGLKVEIFTPEESHIVIRDFGEDYELPIALLGDKDGQAAIDIERRLHALRQLYATIFLLKSGRGKELPVSPVAFDLELKLLKEDERLQISSIGTGSVSATLKGLVKNSGSSIVALVALCIPSLRQPIQRQLRADAKSAEVRAEKDELELSIQKARESMKLGKELAKLSPIEQENALRILEYWSKELNIELPRFSELPEVTDEDSDQRANDT